MINEDYIIQGSERRLICRDSNRIQGLPLVRCVMTEEYRVGQLNKKELLRVLNCEGVSYSAAELYWDYQNKVHSAAELYWNYQNQVYSAAELFRNYQTEVRLAAELYRNVNLRYLAYNQPYDDLKNSLVWELPISASLVWNLLTLIIKGIFPSAVVVASTEFWKMRQLRHVDCHRIYVPGCNGGDEMLVLENMRTLKTAVNFNLSEEVCKSIPNIKKLGLLYTHELHGYDECLIDEHLCNLGRLDKLESLNLDIRSRRWPFPEKHMNEKLRFPSSINKLCLSNCEIEWKDVTEMVGSLPQLQVLMLEEGSVRGREWSPVNGQFLHLKFHFPVLEKLVLRSMWVLKVIPDGIGDIPTLELIRVDVCSMSAAISAVKIKQVQLDYGNDSLQIQVCVYESVVEDFKERVESEGLSISNIQLEY